MASGQASTGTVTGATGAAGADDGWKTVSGPTGDDGWKTVSGPGPGPEPGATTAKTKLFMPHKSDMPMLDMLDRKTGKPKPTKDNVPSMFQGPMGGGEPGGENLQSKILGAYGAAAGIEGVGAAGAALLKGSLRPALGLVAGFGTGYGVDRAARALGAPGWVAESIATLAAIEVGGKVGMSPEMTARLKNSGFKGIIERWINGEPKPNEVNEFYKEKYGKLPETGEERLRAQAEAAEFKKQVALKIRESQKAPVEATRPPIRRGIEEDLYKSKYGDYPKTPQERVKAIREYNRSLRGGKKAKVAGASGDTPAGAAPADKGSSYSFTHPKESLTDVRKQLFSNTQQQKIPNDQVRVRFTQLHGHGISAGTYEEIQQFNEYIARNGKLPDAPSVK